MVERSGDGDDDLGRPVVGGVEPGDLRRRHRRDRRLGAEDRTADGVVGEERLAEQVVDEVVGLVLRHQDLLEDHRPLGLDLVGPERRRPHDVAQDPEPEVEVLGQQPELEDRVLLGREGVQVAADLVDRLGDLACRPVRRPLEQQVLEEVRGPRLLGGLVT